MPRSRRPLTPAPDALTALEKQGMKAWCRDKFPQYAKNGPGGMFDLIESCLNWHRENERWRRHWLQAYREWIRKEARFEVNRLARDRRERPQMDGPRAEDLEELAEVIQLHASEKT